MLEVTPLRERLVEYLNFLSQEYYPWNIFLKYVFFRMFGKRIEFSRMFCTFLKIPLVEDDGMVAVGDRRTTISRCQTTTRSC